MVLPVRSVNVASTLVLHYYYHFLLFIKDASFEARIAGKGVFNQKANVMERHRRALDKRENVFSSQSAVSECAIEKASERLARF